jgi:hypothetical protein
VEQDDVLRLTADRLEQLDIPYMLVGSLASGVYGEPRLTQDIDFVVSPSPAQLDALCAAFPDEDFYVSREAAHAAPRDGRQFNVLHPDSGNTRSTWT